MSNIKHTTSVTTGDTLTPAMWNEEHTIVNSSLDIGDSTNLYQSGVDTLKTDDALQIGNHEYSPITISEWLEAADVGNYRIARIILGANKTLKLWRLNAETNAPNASYFIIMNYSDGTTLDSHSIDMNEIGNPIHSWSYSSEKYLDFRLRNAGPGQASFGANWVLTIED